MLYIGTPNNNDVSRNLLTISGDPALAHFGGTSAVFSPADSLSAVLYNGLASPSPFLGNVNVNDSPLMQGIQGMSLQDLINLLGIGVGNPGGLVFPNAPGADALKKEVSKSAAWLDWKLVAISIFLALLGLIFVGGGVLSFR